MDLEEKVLLLRMRINKMKNDLKEILEKKTDKDKAIFIFDKDDPHLLRKTDNVRV
tara:strand:- start:125 stop:289 length:165 start_codon:yes stop_codon:yes gene_type:complete